MRKIIIGVCITAIVLGCCLVPTVADKFTNDTAMIEAVSPENGAQITLANDLVYEWYSNYSVDANRMAGYAEKADKFFPNEIKLSWSTGEKTDYYRVKYSLNKDLSDAESIVTNNPYIKLYTLYTGAEYYWQVEAVCADKTIRSAVYTFTTAESPRTMYMDGVSNTRDFGGYKVSDTQKIKQGMVYRGGYFNNITADGIEDALYDYRIKTDLDLRNNGEGGAGASSPLGDTVAYKNISLAYYTNIFNSSNYTNLAEAIKVFADKENYPVYIHCSLGRDRTGTLAFLLGGLLGKSKEQLYMDYELSFISVMGNYDNASYSGMLSKFTSMYNTMLSYSDGTINENIEQYVLDIGVTDEEIASIRSIMLEEVK